jgi:hypothetical protein
VLCIGQNMVVNATYKITITPTFIDTMQSRYRQHVKSRRRFVWMAPLVFGLLVVCVGYGFYIKAKWAPLIAVISVMPIWGLFWCNLR